MVNNLKSVSDLSLIVHRKLEVELSMGRISSPFDFPPFINFCLSPLGLVPKKEPDTYYLIHHLSFPMESSLNDQIPDDLLSVSYASFEQAVQKIQLLGGLVLLAKADIKSAFRILPIHPSCFNPLGFQFQGKFYFDRCLPMGCSHSCFYFE